MSVHLIIHDGNLPAWWISPDIWVVPGSDPNGPPGSPIAGKPVYLWARISNTGNTPIHAARVDFYWANPSAQMVVGVATQVGSAYVDIDPGTSQDALCLVPWMPVIVNGGHECVLAVVHGAGDASPLPDPLPNGFPFDPPSHDQVAQLNLSVLAAAMQMPLPVRVVALGREDKRARLQVAFDHQIDERVLLNLGLPRDLSPAGREAVQASLSQEARCNNEPGPAHQELDIEVPRGTAATVFVNIHADKLPPHHYALVHVVEHANGRVTGGVSYLVVNHAHGQQERTS